MRRPVYLSALFILMGVVSAQTAARSKKLPALKTQATPRAVVDEHLDALNHCDWQRLMAQYPDNVEFFVPGGKVVKGRQQGGELFAGFVKPQAEGGLCGLKFTAEHVFQVGDTLNVQWVVTSDILAEPYRGADAIVTKGGLIAAQVSTFDADRMKKRNSWNWTNTSGSAPRRN
jgi:hypothetical protein